MARWLPLLLSMALIFVMSMNHDPYSTLPNALRQPVHVVQTTYDEEEFLGIPGHILEYVLLGVTAANAFVRRKHRSIMAFILVFIGCQIYALSDEFHQLFVPGRAFELLDLGLDAIGILAGLLIYLYATKKFGKTESPG